MKLIVSRESLDAALRHAARCTKARTPSEILRSVLLVAESGLLTVAACDGELFGHFGVPSVDIQTPGKAAVLAETFRAAIGATVGETVTISTDATTLSVRGDSSVYSFPRYKDADFPSQPTTEGKPIDIPLGDFLRLVRQGSSAKAKETSTYAIAGMLLTAKDGRVSFVSTDGKAMVKSTYRMKCHDFSGIVPPNALAALLAYPDGDSVRVTMGANSARFEFVAGNVVLASLSTVLVEGSFPPYESIIPEPATTVGRLTVGKDAFVAAIRAASVIRAPGTHTIGVYPNGDSAEIRSRAAALEVGEARVKVSAKIQDAKPFAYNPDLIADWLAANPDTDITIEQTSKADKGAHTIRSTDSVAVFMPVALEAAPS